MTEHKGKSALAAIVAGLHRVTPGPWRTSLPDDTEIIAEDGTTVARTGEPEAYKENFEAMEADAAHIARCDPDSLRAVSAYVEALEAEVAALRADSEWNYDTEAAPLGVLLQVSGNGSAFKYTMEAVRAGGSFMIGDGRIIVGVYAWRPLPQPAPLAEVEE